MKTKIVNNREKFYNDQDKYLMSYSSMSAPFTKDKFEQIPAFVLDKATQFGSDFSNLVLQAFSGVEIDKYTQEHIKCIKSLINTLKTLKLTPTTIEKHIYNDKWHGYLDIDCESCFVELKTRSKCELELNTVIQCEIYKKICNKEYYIIYLNKKTGVAKWWYSNGGTEQTGIPMKMLETAEQVINCFETLWGLIE